MSKLLTAQQVAERLCVSRQKVWQMARDGEITVIRINQRSMRFDEQDVHLWLDRRTIPGRRTAA